MNQEEKVKELLLLCRTSGLTLSSCESLTAGLFSATVASVSGASLVLKGGFVTYFTQMKEVLVHVPAELIEKEGVVSAACARAMAENTRKLTGSDYAVSFTGNAGPNTMENKPAGCVYCAIAGPKQTDIYHLQIDDAARNEVRRKAVETMLEELTAKIRRENPAG